jgi:GDPmannose 4,6-dehydratase
MDWQKYVEVDSRYFRPAEVDFLLGDASKAKRMMGWSPRVTFKALAKMMTEEDAKLARRERLLAEQEKKEGVKLP